MKILDPPLAQTAGAGREFQMWMRLTEKERFRTSVFIYCGVEKLQIVTSGTGLRGKQEYVTRRDAGLPMQNFPILNKISPEESTLNRVELKSCQTIRIA